MNINSILAFVQGIGLFAVALLVGGRSAIIELVKKERKYGVMLYLVSLIPFLWLLGAVVAHDNAMLTSKEASTATKFVAPDLGEAFSELHVGLIVTLLLWHFVYARHVTFKRSVAQLAGLNIATLDILDYIGWIVTFTVLAFTSLEAAWYLFPASDTAGKLQNIGIVVLGLLSLNIVRNRYRIRHLVIYAAIVVAVYAGYRFLQNLPKIDAAPNSSASAPVIRRTPHMEYGETITLPVDEKGTVLSRAGEAVPAIGEFSFNSDKGASCWELHTREKATDLYRWGQPSKEPYRFEYERGVIHVRARNVSKCLPTRVSITCDTYPHGCGGS
jgi:hypothetical protein